MCSWGRSLTCVLLSLWAALPGFAGEKSEAKAREELVGVWVGYAVEGKGEQPDQGPVKITLTITREVIQGKQHQGDKVIDHGEGSYTLDLGKSPQILDASKKRGNNVQSWVGIYALEGDTLRWCVGRNERPEVFQTKKGAFLLILKRQK